MGTEAVNSNSFVALIGYFLLITGTSHTGVVFYSMCSVLSIIIFKKTNEKKYIVLTLLLYFILSLVTTQKAIFILCILTLFLSYNLYVKQIRLRTLLYLTVLLPLILFWAAVANYSRWASLNNMQLDFFDILMSIDIENVLNYFVIRFDYFISATYALSSPSNYPGEGVIGLIKAFAFFIPYNSLFGLDMFSVKFAKAYLVPGYDIGVGVTVPTIIDIKLGFDNIISSSFVYFIYGFSLERWGRFTRELEVTTTKIVALCLIPIVYIASASAPLFEIIYNISRSIIFIIIFLFFSRVLYSAISFITTSYKGQK
jgi:hypothetical protein